MYCHSCVKWVRILHMLKSDENFGPCKPYLRKHTKRVPTSCCWMLNGGGTEAVSVALIRSRWMLNNTSIGSGLLCILECLLLHWHHKLWIIWVRIIRIIQMNNGGHHFTIFLPVLQQLLVGKVFIVTLCCAILNWYFTVISKLPSYTTLIYEMFLGTGERENKASLTVHELWQGGKTWQWF